ncbi:HEPN domain-containing protein [Dorea sp. OM02-2LB]|nr:HEPN domain-containing protein [Dorea sp. OM02-2LB]
MPKIMQDLIKQYVEAVKKIYGSHVRQIILYGSYARGDFRPDSDVDIMILVLYRRETARNDLKSARALFFIEDYKGANNRAYYSIFHAINAVYAVSGKAYKRHKDAVANFNKDYVKTSVFPREMGRKIGQAEEIRHASDYDDFYIASKEESEQQISVADEFIILAEKYCLEQLEEQKEY